MKKFYFLGLAMLFGVVNIGHAQVSITDAVGLQTAKNELGKIDGYTKKISDNTSLINTYQVQLAGEDKDIVTEKTETKTENKGYGGTERTAITNFTERKGGSLKFGLVSIEDEDWGETENSLYVFADGQTIADVDMSDTYTISVAGLNAAGTDISKGNNIDYLYIYYAFPVLSDDKSEIKEYTYKKVMYTLPTAGNTNKVLMNALKEAMSKLPDPDVNYVTITTTTTTTETTPNNKYTTFLTNMTALKTENSYYNALLNGGTWTVYSVVDNEEVSETSTETIATGCNAYKRLSIENSFSIKDANFTMGDWGSDYTIAGNGNVITYPAGANGALTGINRGLISNLGVVNGKVATTNGGTIKTAFETTDGNTYDLYDAAGTHTTSKISGELGYRVRQYFGLTINANGTLGTLDKKTTDNTVYKAEWTKADTKTTATFYANVKAGDLSYNPAANKKNMFVYVQDTDIDATAFTVGKNIVVNGECQNAVFVDDAAEGDDGWVYIPTAFTAKNLAYERVFKSTALATTCLPFEVPATAYNKMGVEKIMQFSNVDTQTGTYWFQYQDGSMKANEPYVLKFKNEGQNLPNEGKIFKALKNISVAATGNIDRYEVAPSRRGTGAEFLGVFVSTNASMLARGGYKLYGFGNGVFRPMTVSADNKCQAFRTYIKTPDTNNAPAADLVIGELDEYGNVVSGGTTGVGTAVADADAFGVKGGNGVVIITTGKAQKVSVYTVGGSLVKAANVEAGTVTVPVAAGVYIVNGKKVVVK